MPYGFSRKEYNFLQPPSCCTVKLHCWRHRFLTAPVKISTALPVRRQSHPIIHDLLAQLQGRLRPLHWLTNNSSGISIPVARTIYITFIRFVIHYLFPALIQLLRVASEPLDCLKKDIRIHSHSLWQVAGVQGKHPSRVSPMSKSACQHNRTLLPRVPYCFSLHTPRAAAGCNVLLPPNSQCSG